MKKRQLILAVDDDQEMLRIIKRTLELEGYSVATAANGSTAVTLLKEQGPDLVILDIVRPKMDGFQVLDIIRQYSDIPIIMLTAKCEVTTMRDALVLGADDYMRKPFSTRVLAARVRAKLRRAKQQVPRRTKDRAPGLESGQQVD